MAKAKRLRGKDLTAALITAKFEDDERKIWEETFGKDLLQGQRAYQKLALRLFEYHCNSRSVFKTTAAKLLPAQHSVTALKYLDEAEKRGWVTFIPDDIDGRKIHVVPTDTFLELTRTYLRALTSLLSKRVQELKQLEDPPP